MAFTTVSFIAFIFLSFWAQDASAADVTGTYNRQGVLSVAYREVHINKERQVQLTCKWLKGKKTKSTECFKNTDPHSKCDNGYTNNEAAHYLALAKNYADRNCRTNTVYGPGKCKW